MKLLGQGLILVIKLTVPFSSFILKIIQVSGSVSVDFVYLRISNKHRLRMEKKIRSDSQICPEMQINKMHAPYDNPHKVCSFLKRH